MSALGDFNFEDPGGPAPSRGRFISGSDIVTTVTGSSTFSSGTYQKETVEGMEKRQQPPVPSSSGSGESHRAAGEKAAGAYDSSSDSFEAEEQRQRDKQVTAIARTYTRQSNYSDVEGDPFDAEKDSILDPLSANFKPRAWTKALLKLQARDPNNYQQRTAGFAFRSLNVFGFGSSTDYQKSVGNIFLEAYGMVKKLVGFKGRRIDILRNLDGVVNDGEMLVVLGPPGSGCSTFLKTIAGETHGFYIDKDSYLNYQGISPAQMHKDFRGEAIYTAEVDVHFPMLTVADTLAFAGQARAPRVIPGGLTRKAYGQFLRDVIMAQFGISHTRDTRVGNDFIRGVSGGERKRVTIAEASLSGAPLQCWDNSTRGLDSANAIEFCKTVRQSTDLAGVTAAVAIYQSPQTAYDVFDKVIVLYRGRQIYFGRTTEAQAYFEKMGFQCPDRQTTPDFLTSMTSPQERVIKEGFENKVPRTPDEFETVWKNSPEYGALIKEIDEYDKKHTIGGESLELFKESRRKQQSKRQRIGSPYTLSYYGQVMLCMQRGFQRLKGDPSLTFVQLFGNFIMALIIGSIFYNLDGDTDSFFSRSALLFFAILLNAFGSSLEILVLYAQRPIVEKQARYAFYHPSCEAFASMLVDMPYKVMNAITFNLTLYFLTNLRREPGAFFFFVLISFFLTLAMSMLFRFIASVSRTLAQAMTPTAILILAILIYTGFALPVPSMLGWSRWINYLDVVAYGFESLMLNEFYGRNFNCSVEQFVPNYGNLSKNQKVCMPVGSQPGQAFVNGGVFIAESYQYDISHKWRNLWIIIVFMIGLGIAYLVAAEFVTAKKSKGEVLVFPRGHIPAHLKKQLNDEETLDEKPVAAENLNRDISHIIAKQTAIFHWKDICFDIKIKGEPRRILDHVDGWVKPGTLTALMGVSGAGKTTLLDCLATRTTIGVVSGEALVDGRQRDTSFQRKTGYVQQQDLHLETSTVREALNFSALLRQPRHVPKQEKLDYVDQVIQLLDMEEYADAIVGVPGEGLNVEQRKRLTIGVELAAKPQLLLFLDEPTSGLDSQTSWAILDLLEKLTKNGQAILCTIHQPSAMLFQRFDRLLFLAEGGKTVYFGDVGKNSQTLTKYFESKGAYPCPANANPAEWMLEVIGAAPGSHSDTDWFKVWRESDECKAVHDHLAELKSERPKIAAPSAEPEDRTSYREFAAPLVEQFRVVTKRVFEQYWRTPSYIYSKTLLCVLSALFIGFSFFKAGTSQQALQNQMFAIFMLFTIFSQLVQQAMPHFVTQRALYEARERPSKAYSWKAFMFANAFVELPVNALMGTLIFFCWYYPIGLYRNAEATDTVHARGGLMFLLVLTFLLFTSTFTTMIISAIETAETAGNIANLMFSLMLIFCGVLAGPSVFPGFWIFMYRISPFTYLVSSILSTGLANTAVVCSAKEFIHFEPPSGLTCAKYMHDYIYGVGGRPGAGGYLQNPQAMSNCSFCSLSSTNQFLDAVNSSYSTRWRDFGILWVYIIFNLAAAFVLYYLVRVPKHERFRFRKPKKE